MTVLVPETTYYLKGGKYIIDKDGDDTLDYSLDHSRWLTASDNDTIANCTVVLDPALESVNVSFDATTTTAWIRGGSSVAIGTLMPVTFRITTANTPARIRDFTIYLKRIER